MCLCITVDARASQCRPVFTVLCSWPSIRGLDELRSGRGLGLGLGTSSEGDIVKSAYRVIARLVAVGVILQAMFIALGTFLLWKDIDDGLIVTTDYNWAQGMHGLFGLMVIPLLAIVLLIVSFFAHIRGGVKWAGIVLGLVLLQVVLAFTSFGIPAVGALHGLNAFAVLFAADYAARRVSKVDVASETSVAAAV